MVFDSFIAERLTPRQLEVAYLMVLGYSNEKIASLLIIELCTVKAHVARIIKKVYATNKIHAAFIIGRHVIED